MRIPFVCVLLFASVPALASADQQQIRAWVEDLRDDDVRWNATSALYELTRVGAEAIRALENALQSDDRQQRMLAATVLGRFASEPRFGVAYAPSRALAAALIESLSSDEFPIERDDDGNQINRTPAGNAATATRVFLAHSELTVMYRSELERVIKQNDTQGRFLAAYILGMNGVEESIPVAAPVLLDHLRENDMYADAVWASAALCRFGPELVPFIDRQRLDDPQQLEIAMHIRHNLVDPPSSHDEMVARGIKLSCIYHDPTLEYTHQDLWLEWWAFDR